MSGLALVYDEINRIVLDGLQLLLSQLDEIR